ncbi:hypothetical protein K504DRAFT_461884 [Pleomassaria siparia CBS 279.74]|uniref:Uncharacterized protein n=1 Tax=Pleomassaria siparia CBS 279.74 TaxID=1314801 RepID=A0A6G1KLT2_9PLEO|nr:hypothetical protein K504DRAFT_461884 [Pleomassaria siparia CBS 279.74]
MSSAACPLLTYSLSLSLSLLFCATVGCELCVGLLHFGPLSYLLKKPVKSYLPRYST